MKSTSLCLPEESICTGGKEIQTTNHHRCTASRSRHPPAFVATRVLPDRVRVGVIASDGGDDPPWLLPLPDSHLVVTLRQHRAFVDVVDVDGDGGRGRRAVAAADQSHRVLSAQHQDVLALTLKVQDLKTSTHTHTHRIRISELITRTSRMVMTKVMTNYTTLLMKFNLFKFNPTSHPIPSSPPSHLDTSVISSPLISVPKIGVINFRQNMCLPL